MFFLGIIGVMDRKKRIRKINLSPCRICDDTESGMLFKVERVFSFFFLPLFHWNTRYGVQCRRCGSLYWISKEKGEKLEKGQEDSIGYWDMLENKMVRGGVCPHCQKRILPTFDYCPHCGKKLK